MNINEYGQLTFLKFSEVGPTDGLVAWWKLDGNARDCSGSNAHGTINGAVTSVGISGPCLQFDGVNDYVGIPSSANAIVKPTNYVTVSAWVYRPNWADGLSQRIVSCTEEGGYQLGYNEVAGQAGFVIYITGVGYVRAYVPTTGITSGWHLFTGTFDGRYAKFYMDGVFAISIDAGSIKTITYNASNTLQIGAEAGGGSTPVGQYWAGLIDNVRVYNRALSEEEVGILYSVTAGQSKMKLSEDGTLYIQGEFKEVI